MEKKNDKRNIYDMEKMLVYFCTFGFYGDLKIEKFNLIGNFSIEF